MVDHILPFSFFFVIQGAKTCRGTLVTKSMVLTAAHCLIKVNTDESVSTASSADITVHHGKNCCFCQQCYGIMLWTHATQRESLIKSAKNPSQIEESLWNNFFYYYYVQRWIRPGTVNWVNWIYVDFILSCTDAKLHVLCFHSLTKVMVKLKPWSWFFIHCLMWKGLSTRM